MAGANFPNDNLVSVDPSILSCWGEKVKEGFDCILMLKHSKGKVTTVLKCSKLVASPDARKSVPQPAVSPTQVEVAKGKKKRRKMNKKKLESLMSYQERLVREKGLPPSRLMLQHAADVQPLHASKEFQCDQCEFSSTSKRGLSKHKSCKHKKSEEPETLRETEQNQSLNLSQASEEREELFPVNADTEVVDAEEVERMGKTMEETNKCIFCGFEAPVAWVDPSKGNNLSGNDIWDHVWANHPDESEWFA